MNFSAGNHRHRPEYDLLTAAYVVCGLCLATVAIDETLRDSGVPFVAADMPEANTLTIWSGVWGCLRRGPHVRAGPAPNSFGVRGLRAVT